MLARHLEVTCILGRKIDSSLHSVTEEHGRIVQLRPNSNLLRSTICITSGLLVVFKSSLIFLQQVSSSLIIGLDFSNRRSNKNFLFLRMFCNRSPWSFLIFGQVFDQVCYCSVKTELIDRNDHLKDQLNVFITCCEVYCCPSSFAFQLSPVKDAGASKEWVTNSLEVSQHLLCSSIPRSIGSATTSAVPLLF